VNNCLKEGALLKFLELVELPFQKLHNAYIVYGTDTWYWVFEESKAAYCILT